MFAVSPSPDTPIVDSVEPRAGSGRAYPQVDWAEVVREVRGGSAEATERFYQQINRGMRYILSRQFGAQDLDDKVHDTFLIVVKAIRRGDLREPERLMGFVRTVTRRQVAAYIDVNVRARREEADLDIARASVPDPKRTPEQELMFRQKTELMKAALAELSDRDKEILTRFYLREQRQEQICREMELTETQFRLFKSRAKAKFGEIGRKKLMGRQALAVLARRAS